MAEVLLEQVNPYGTLMSVVEADERVCYLYLYGKPGTDFGMRTVWVRNHQPAPVSLDVTGMRAGTPPLNPKAHCRHPGNGAPLQGEQLRLLWLPEGNGVALYEQNELLAIIPPWSGVNGFDGYARDAVGEGPLAWELSPDNALIGRFQDAGVYWSWWERDDFWSTFRDGITHRLEQLLGTHTNYYAIDGGNWPTKAMLRIPRPDGTVFVTLGMSLTPQPNVEMYAEDPSPYRRIELAALLPSTWSEEQVLRFGGYLSGQTQFPWNHQAWLGPNHTILCDAWANPAYRAAVLLRQHPALPTEALGQVCGDPANILWLLPITLQEQDQAQKRGTEALLRRLPATRWQDA